jgi:hypothetical protein
VIGIPFAIVALKNYSRVKKGGSAFWNPAERYLRWGGICARLTLFLWLVALALIITLGLYAYATNP